MWGRSRRRWSRPKSTESLGAYDYFLRGRAALHEGSVQGHKDALQLFYRAIELDPDFASAYGMAAYSYCHRKTNGWMVDREEEVVETVRLARRAVELDQDDAVSLSCGGFSLAYVAGELDAGVAFIDRALLLNPNLATAWIVSGWVRVWLGEPEVAIEHLARAMRLSPLDPLINRTRTTTAHAHFFAGRYGDASSWAAMALREWPDYQTALRMRRRAMRSPGAWKKPSTCGSGCRSSTPSCGFPISRMNWGRTTDRKTSPDMSRVCGRRDCPTDQIVS